MPDQKALNALTYIASKNPADIQDVRLAGVTKPFEQLTISELVQLRPGAGVEDAGSYSVNAVSSDVTISTSSALSELAQMRAQEAVKMELAANEVHNSINGVTAVRNVITKFER